MCNQKIGKKRVKKRVEKSGVIEKISNRKNTKTWVFILNELNLGS